MPSAAPPPGLYLHIPFCSEVCPYCDFAVAKASAPRRERFVEDLLAEMRLLEAERQPFDTLYFGGGTPSILPAEQLERVLDGARDRLGALSSARVYLEANPEDVTPASAAAWRRLGVATLSLGVQSFDDDELAFLGRRHRGEHAERAVEHARAAGFETVSVDLIFGLPEQPPARWRASLERAVALGADHVSCYQLTVHEGTPFAKRRQRGELAELAEGPQAELFALTHSVLGDLGYEGYEVSNFARGAHHRSRHNQKYWRHAPYLGIGPSAHSFDGQQQRSWNERRTFAYQERVRRGERPLAGSEVLSASELALEAVMLSLRTRDGLDIPEFAARYGVDLRAANAPLFARWEEEGLVILRDERIEPTVRGLAVADALAASVELGV